MVRKSYSFSRREIARHKCRDCGVNVIKVPAAIIREGGDQGSVRTRGRDIDGLAAGIKIGLRVREMDWATSVTNECASVCGMIWLAGTILFPAQRGRAEQRLSSVDQSTRRSDYPR
jgi:hypothetical protein